MEGFSIKCLLLVFCIIICCCASNPVTENIKMNKNDKRVFHIKKILKPDQIIYPAPTKPHNAFIKRFPSKSLDSTPLLSILKQKKHGKLSKPRHHGPADESHMFVIKLPPSQYYYVNNKPALEKNSIADMGKRISFGFESNGKPNKIYHWNLPYLRKMFSYERGRPNSRLTNNIDELIDIAHIPTWTKHNEPEPIKKEIYDHHFIEQMLAKRRKEVKHYNTPVRSKQLNLNHYPMNNGKPHSVYLLNTKNNQIKFHQKIMP